ncbi:MAG: integrase/recombinase XerD [Psychroserpens sp.]|jgi:integrase/recombinase XerD
MPSNKPTFSIVLDKRKKNKLNLYPIKLRVTYLRENIQYSLGMALNITDFEKLSSPKLRDTLLKGIKHSCDDALFKSREISARLEHFSFSTFKEQFFGKQKGLKDTSKIETLFASYIQSLKSEGRVSTYQSYQNAFNSLNKFKQKLKWSDITVELLNQYEKWMLSKDSSMTTIGIYLRSLRAIFNLAIRNKYIGQDHYPFGKGKYQIPAGRNIKKALTIEEIQSIFNYEIIAHPAKEFARDLWLFSYLCNGINIKDIAHLKYSNHEDCKITFIRAKTRLSTKSNQSTINVILNSKAEEIIRRWGTKPALEECYIFPILPSVFTPEEERKVIQNRVSVTNNYMKKIGADLGIKKNITSYVARHSFSTVLKRSGVSTEYISEALGHTSLATTENYLDSFEDDTKKKYSDLLTNF